MRRRLLLLPLCTTLLLACEPVEPTPAPTPIPDADADGVPDAADCGPNDATIYDGAPETGTTDPSVTAGDTKDNDCDGLTDEGTDAYDDDGDTFSEDGAVGGASDCDDAAIAIYPGAAETPYDGIDQDCDGFDLDDVDQDGYPSDQVTGGTDCDDADPAVYPEAPEDGGAEPPTNLGDDRDNDCDGATDEGMLDTDDDEDGFTDLEGDCDDEDADRYPEHLEVPYDGVDQDCDLQDLVDVDEDGFASTQVEGGTDCDDANPTIYGGAPELCDGIDNNCDEVVPEAEGYTDYWPDQDEDGFGDDALAFQDLACAPPEGAVIQGGDCDDADPDRFPGNPEICDGLDNDCDEATSELEGYPVYPDVDGDGYGADAGMQEATLCSPAPEGYIRRPGDCDDTLVDVHEGAPERCDGLDNDCDASTLEGPDVDADGDGSAVCTGEGATLDCDDSRADVGPGELEWRDDFVDNDCDGNVDNTTSGRSLSPYYYLQESLANLGRYLDGGLDLDGDGLDELVLGSPQADFEAVSAAGQAFVMYGREPFEGASDVAEGGAGIYGTTSNDNAGEAVALCPDLDGDGLADLAVGVPRDPTGGTSRGGVFIYFGAEARLSGGLALASADVSIINRSTARMFGNRLACVPDMTGDGLGELVVAAGGGRINIYPGRRDWPVTLQDGMGPGDEGPVVIMTGAVSGTEEGTEVSFSGGDLDGDGLAELVIGDPEDTNLTGKVYIVKGVGDLSSLAGALSEVSERVIPGPVQAGRYGQSVDARLDVNGDGRADLFTAASAAAAVTPERPGTAGRIFVFLGQLTLPGLGGVATADLVFAGAVNGDRAGTALRVVPDVTGDGLADLIVHGATSDGSGRLYVVGWRSVWPEHTGDLGLDVVANLLVLGQANDAMGLGIAPMGTHFGGDGGLVFSAYQSDVAGDNFGQVYLVEGRLDEPTPTPTPWPLP